ncbi:MAG: glutamine--tRNA ligase/YqeY domain fusion protein [Syntrophomonadaceae bacterium]|jgi:glutaminyl-tRNA synthetase|nr:glutamine--tRNA ligase/YqeY domain fusion protein [Bacillota bacterium]
MSDRDEKSLGQETADSLPVNFIQTIITEDLKSGKNNGRVHTRFPPEPNGYLHIGHAKSICLNFGLAAANGGICNLRFDDTNPSKEEIEYVESIQDNVRWLGFDWEDRLYYASDYFDQLFEFACQLINKGQAYVCDLSAEEIREYRGTLTEPGKESPYRNRSIEENLDLFMRMKNGEFPDGARVLRAKIDMASPNLNMRDPVLYRIQHAHHHRTGDKWCIYPMYDYAHPLSDALESITHSVCTLEFADHRPLYDWCIEQVDYGKEIHGRPQQIEFARLNLTYTVMSKRKLRLLVEKGVVGGWDDPRMPTISGLRRRGYTPEAIRDFCDRIGVAKRNSTVDIALLEHCIREDLNRRASRVMAVLRPLKVVITNYPEDKVEWMTTENNIEQPEMGIREIPFAREIYIEQEDFMEDPPKKFFRLRPGGEVRLKSAYIIECQEVIKDDQGRIVELHCTYDPDSKSGGPNAGRRVKGTLHWVSAQHAIPAEVRLYDQLFLKENPDDEEEGKDFTSFLNPDSLEVLKDSLVEPSLADAAVESSYQFLRQGYFVVDPDSSSGKLVFNRIVGLRDSWAKIQNKQG